MTCKLLFFQFNPIKDKFQLLYQIRTLFEQQIRNTICPNDFQAKCNLNLNSLHIYVIACHIIDAYWFIYRVQTPITLL